MVKDWGISGYSVHTIGRVIFVKGTSGMDVFKAIEEAMDAQGVKAAMITGIGGFRYAKIGTFNPATGEYESVTITREPHEVLEIVGLHGNSIRSEEGRYYTHLHITLSKGDRVYAGHLLEAVVDPLLEAFIFELIGGYERLLELMSHRLPRA